MKKISSIFLMFMFASFAHANPDHSVKSKAQNLTEIQIKKCEEATSVKRSSTSTEMMREGNLDLALCLENHIMELSDHLFAEDAQYKKEMESDLEKLRSSYGRFYWNLYNSHDRCYTEKGIQCGTFYHPLHNARYAELLENMLVDTYKQLLHYGYIE